MSTFQDLKGRSWSLALTFADVKRVRKQLDVDLLHVDTGSLLTKLAEDPLQLLELAEVIIGPQLKEQEVNLEDFERAIDGDVIAKVCDAFVESLIAFFRSCRPNASRAMESLWTRLKDLQTKASELTAEKLNGEELDQVIEKHLQEASETIDKGLAELTSGNTPTNSREP